MHTRKYIVAGLLLALVTTIGIASATYYIFWTHRWESKLIKPKGAEGVVFEIVEDFSTLLIDHPNVANVTFENVDPDFMYLISANLSITGPCGSDAISPEWVTARWQTWQNGTWEDDFIIDFVDKGATLNWFGDEFFYVGCSEFDRSGYYLITVTFNEKAEAGVYKIDLEFSGESIFGC